jgi:hypothetical protein
LQKVEKCQFRSHEIRSLDHSPNAKWSLEISGKVTFRKVFA